MMPLSYIISEGIVRIAFLAIEFTSDRALSQTMVS